MYLPYHDLCYPVASESQTDTDDVRGMTSVGVFLQDVNVGVSVIFSF